MRYNEEECIKRCNELDVEFVGTHKESKKGTVIEYICNKHRDKGIQYCDWSHFQIQKKSCPYCYGRYKTLEEVQNEVPNKDVELISEYLGNEKPILCRCRACGNEWTTQPKVLLTNKAGCPKCGRIKANLHETKTQEDFENDLKRENENIEIIGKYIGAHKKIKCRCKIDGTV